MTTITRLKKLYEIDDNLWLEETIKILKERKFNDLDLDNLVEELESLGRSDKNAVESLLEQVIRHLLLLQYWTVELEHNSSHWEAEVYSFRKQLNRKLTTNLQNYLLNKRAIIYQDALEYLQRKTKFKVDFPQECPYTLEQILDINYLP